MDISAHGLEDLVISKILLMEEIQRSPVEVGSLQSPRLQMNLVR